MFPVPKGDGSWRPIIDLRELNQFITPHHFKMEGIRAMKGLIRKNDWMAKLDLKDAYLSVPIYPPHRNYLSFQWQKKIWEFKSLPFGLRSAPHAFTKLLKPVVALLRKLVIRCILYLDDMLIMAQSKQDLQSHLATAIELLTLLGFIINTKKSVFKPTQKIEFLGFQIDSTLMCMSLPKHKAEVIRKSVVKVCREEREIPTRQIASLLGLMVAAHPAVLPAPIYYRALQREKIRAVRQRGYNSMTRLTPQVNEELNWWLKCLEKHNGSSLQITQWDLTIETDASTQGWGASCQGTNTGGPWTKLEQHQLPGTTSSVPGSESVRSEGEPEVYPTQDGQCNSDLLCEQDGRYPLVSNVESGSRGMEMVHCKIDQNTCRASTRERECTGRLAITPLWRLQRLKAGQGSVHQAERSDGTIHHRSLRLQNEQAVASVLQLEARSIRIYSGCTINPMDQSIPVPLSTVYTDQQMHRKDQAGESRSSDDCTCLAEPSMVSKTPGGSDRRTHPPPDDPGHLAEHARRGPPTGDQGPPPSSRMAHIRQSLSSRGFSEGVIGILKKSWREATESAYGSVWRKWDSWCLTRNLHPISAPLSEILEFLLEEFNSGKQYRTLNTARSAISMTHSEVDGVRVGQHEIVSHFMKGLFNSRPPLPRYTSTWDVDIVLKYLSALPEDELLQLPILTHKLAMLLALTNANRSSELAALDLQYCSMQAEGVRFVIPGLTKTRRTGPPKEVFFTGFTANRKICPVSTLISYRQRTKKLRTSGLTRLFISVRRPHRPVKPATIGHWLKKVMEKAGIDVSIFSAHSTRGAATSKAKAAGVSVPEILKAADRRNAHYNDHYGQNPEHYHILD